MVRKYDLTGQTYGNLKVLHDSGERSSTRSIIWVCQCKCGNITKSPSNCLRNGESKTCGKCPINFYQDNLDGTITGTTLKNETFLIDAIHLDIVQKHNWFVNDAGYLISTVKSNGKLIRQHVLIAKELGEIKEHSKVDHINHITTDNRSCNLRIANHQQNMCNQKIRKNTSSQYKGVSFFKDCNKWRAYIKHNYKQISLGLFDDEIEAAKRYNEKAKELFGEFALLNKI